MNRPFSDKRPIGPIFSSDNNILSSKSEKEVVEEILDSEVDWVDVFFHSSERMPELQDNSVALMVTSPPYNIGWEYGDFNDERRYVEDYLSELATVFNTAYDKLMPEGRLAVNVPTIDKSVNERGLSVQQKSQQFIPVASDITQMIMSQADKFGTEGIRSEEIEEMQSETDWKLFDHIIWNKGTTGAKELGLGSLGGGNNYPFRFIFNSTQESILIFQKPGKRDLSKVPREFKQASKINKSFWDRGAADPPEMCSRYPQCSTLPKDNLWTARTGSMIEANGERVPTFPEKLPKRLIRGLTYVGDTVVDPFAGAGTTLKVAKKYGRMSRGYELREELRPVIEGRVGEKV